MSGLPVTESSTPDTELKAGPSQGRSNKRQEDKKCGVCGDRALGYNFNAITCESCKAFFRRNALRDKDFRCPFSDECEVTSVTRRFCQRCRLRKCFDIGMKKEWIMSEDEKKKKRSKIQQNRYKKLITDQPPHEETSQHPEPMDTEEQQERLSNKRRAQSSSKGRLKSNKHQKKVRLTTRASSHGISYAESDSDRSHSPITTENMDNQVASPTAPLLIPKKEVEEFIPTQSTTVPNDPYTGEVPKRPLEYHDGIDRSHEIPSSTVTYFEDGLVANLLRCDSQSPNSRQSVYGQISNDVTNSERMDGSHANGQENMHHNVFKHQGTYENALQDSSLPTQRNDGHGHRYSEEAPYNCSEQGISQSNSQKSPLGHHINDSSDVPFIFNIQDALQVLQPGCRNREPTTYAESVMDSIVNTAISSEYSAFSIFSNKSTSELNQAEKMKLAELFEANRGLLAPLCEDANFKDLPDPSLINVINLTEIAIRRLIKMSKKISSFRNLCQEDQIALLKAGCTELMILKSVSAYDPDKDSWKIKQDQHSFKSIKLKVLKTAPGNVYEEHKRYIFAFKPEWRQDLNIMLLLSAIVLFTPERPFILHREAIRHEQSSYLYLLKRYLEIKYHTCEGVSNFYKLLERISQLHVLNEDHVRVFLEANPKEMEPLLIEIFDLKQS